MVHVATRRPSLGSALGEAVGSIGGNEVGYQMKRNRTLNALQEAQTAAQGAQNPIDLYFALHQATAGDPGAQKAIGQIFPELVKTIGSGQYSKTLTGGKGGGEAKETQNMPSNADILPKASTLKNESADKRAIDEDFIASNYTEKLRPDLSPGSPYGQVISFNDLVKTDLRPEEEGLMRQEMQADKIMPDIQNQIINRVRENIQTRFKEKQMQYGLDKEKQAQVASKYEQFQKASEKNLEPYLNKYVNDKNQPLSGTQGELRNKYFEYAQEEPINKTPEEMHTSVIQKLQNDMNQIDQLKTIPSMPPFRSPEELEDNIELIANAYKPLLEKGGFDQTVREDAFTNKDMGVENFHYAVYGDQTDKKMMNEIHSVKPPKLPMAPIQEEAKTNKLSKAAVFKRAPAAKDKNYIKDEEKYVSELSTKLKELGPNDDLILARAMVLDAGGTEQQFTRALKEAQQKGWKPSDFQQNQLVEVNIPRKRPIWEVFSPNGFKAQINLIRGKR